MSVFEQKSLQYYSSSLDKLDMLLEQQEDFQEDTNEYRDNILEKLNSLEKIESAFNSITKLSDGILSIISKKGLKVDFEQNEVSNSNQDELLERLESLEKAESTFNSITKLSDGILSIISRKGLKVDFEQNEVSNTNSNQDNLISKLNFIDKDGPLYNAILNVSSLLESVISKDKLNVSLMEGEFSAALSNNTIKKESKDDKSKQKASKVNNNVVVSGENNMIFVDAAIPSFKGFVRNVKRVGKGVKIAAKFDPKGVQNLKDTMASIKEVSKDFETVSKSLKYLALGILGLGASLVAAGALYVLAVPGMIAFYSTVKLIGTALKAMPEESKDKTKALLWLGASVLALGTALTLATPLYILGLPTAVLFSASVAAIGLGLKVLPEAKETKEAAQSLLWVSLSIATLGTALLAWQLYDIKWETYAAVGATLITIGLLFAGLNKIGKQVKRGAIALGFVSLSLLAFATTLAIMDSIIGSDWENYAIKMGILGLSLAGLGIIYWGLGKVLGSIIKGSLAVGAIGLSLLPLGFSMGMIMDIDWEWEKLAQFGTTLLGLGLIYAGAGVVSSFILQGAIAFGLVGLSLIPIAFSMGMIMDINWDWEKMAQFGTTLLGLGLIYAAAGAVSPLILAGSAAFGGIGLSLIALEEGLSRFNGLKTEDLSFFTDFSDGKSGFAKLMIALGEGASEIASFSNVLGAGAMAAIGLALQELSKGIEPFIGDDNVFVDALEDDLGGTLSKFLNALTEPFLALGGKKGTSLTGLIFGGDLGMPDALNGARSVAAMGDALQSIAKGIQPFIGDNNPLVAALSDITKVPDLDNPGKMKTVSGLGARIGAFISTLSEPFLALQQGKTSKSLIGLVFGNDLGITDAQAGANSVAAMGDALQSIAKGVQPFVGSNNAINNALTNMIEVDDPENPGKKKTVSGLGNKIGVFISTLSEPFLALNKGSSSASLTGLVFGNDFGINDAQEGAKSVQSMGDALQSIAAGVKPFVGKDNAIVAAINPKNNLGDNIAKFIIALTAPFIAVARVGKASNNSILSGLIGTDFSMNEAQEGAKSVIDMGQALINIGDGTKKFQEISGKINTEKFKNNLGTFVGGLPGAFENIKLPDGDTEDKLEFFDDSLARVIKSVENADKLKGVASSYDSIAKSFASIASSTGDISSSINSMKIENVKELGSLLYNAKEFLVEANSTSFEDAVDGMGDQIMKLATSVGSFLSSDDGEEGSENAINNKALTKQDLLNVINVLKESVDSSNERVIEELERVSATLNSGTINVRETNI